MNDWFSETGLWIAVAVASAIASFFLLRLGLRNLLPRIARGLGGAQLLDILSGPEDASTIWPDVLIGLAVATGAALAIAAELGADLSVPGGRLEEIGLDAGRWAGTHGLRAVVILVAAIGVSSVLSRVLPPFLRTSLSRGKQGIELEEAFKRADALAQVSRYALNAAMVLIALVMVLAELGFNLAPLLAGVGIIGIALGFGAQHLVRDIIAGTFVLVEDHYRVGDVASVGGKTGLVEAVSLRRTVLRDLDGIVHIIPNGEITTASNFTKSFSRVNLNISVAYKEDLDRVIRVLDRVGADLAQDGYFSGLIIEPPRVLRVDSFDDSGISIKMVGVTKPIRQWEVAGELRRRVKREFDREDIEIPFPHRTVYWGVDSHPQAKPAEAAAEPVSAIADAQDHIVLPTVLPIDPWAREFEALASATGAATGAPGRLMDHLDEVRALLHRPPVALFTAIDGTLAPIALEPRFARITPAVRQALNVLSKRLTVVILTGRDVAGARALVGLPSVIYEGSHGLEEWERGTATVAADVQISGREIRRLVRDARSAFASTAGIVVEEKPFSVAIHYRQAIDRAAAREAILAFLEGSPRAAGMVVYEGSMVVEIRAATEINKGTAIRSAVEKHEINSVIVLGDDLTDVDAFDMVDHLRETTGLTGCNIAVTGRDRAPLAELTAAADYQLDDAEAVEIFLAWMAAETGR